MNYETSAEIEVAIYRYFGESNYVIVPNVSWGMFDYELDMCLLSKSFYATEIEIKISRADLLRDAKKKHVHDSEYVRRVYFAVPQKIVGCTNLIPERFGVLVIDQGGYVTEVRRPEINRFAKKWDVERAYKLARLGAMRVWSYKTNLITRLQSHLGVEG